MNDLKKFLEKKSNKFTITTRDGCVFGNQSKYVPVESLGLFFWNRYGKRIIDIQQNEATVDDNRKYAEWIIKKSEGDVHVLDNGFEMLEAQDFLDCLDCLGESKIKELIEELNKGGNKK